ncbi:hypothetical protein JR316_0001468 [Psilocybe cubensis]|uniref:Uncharacterized protein n=2 Tax=Psilocybe cubensis TaxID=181762 RepID=A0ACB8HHS2_PSICU|nr:hypothetical protein JR316_0001468 [Psilocybe cubensis]KAH9487393.1 hypothetical protein JR316_0001468 [Psilocybe cubensis]
MGDFLQGVDDFLIQHGAALEAQRRGCTRGQPEGLPNLTLQANPTAWIHQVETDLAACKIHSSQWKYGCYLYMPQALREQMKTNGSRILGTTHQDWPHWNGFKQNFLDIIDFYYGHKNRIREKMLPLLEQYCPGLTIGTPIGLPPLDSTSFSSVWIPKIKEDFKACDMPRMWETRAAMLYLPDRIRQHIEMKHVENWKENGVEWTLEDFIQEVQAHLDTGVAGAASGVTLEPLLIARGLGVLGLGAAGAAAGVILGPPLIVGGLGALGFGASGVAAGNPPSKSFLSAELKQDLS